MASAPQKTIGGRAFSFGTLSATEAVRVEVAIARVIGEPLFKAFVKAQEIQAAKGLKTFGALKADADATALLTSEATAAIGLIAARMDADELLKTMDRVFASIACDGKPIQIDATFTGRNKEMWLVFVEGLRVNFADFFPDDLSLSSPAGAGT
jgi:hypothetical protein